MTSSVYFGRCHRQMLVWNSSDSWSCHTHTTVVIDSLCSQWTEAPPKQLPKSILNWESKVNEIDIFFPGILGLFVIPGNLGTTSTSEINALS